MSLTQQAHQAILAHLSNAGRNSLRFSIDATCGNGHDTLFLATHTELTTFGFDVQAHAIDNTQQLLIDAKLSSKAQLIQRSHAEILTDCQQYADCLRKVDALMFNLGYLPRADKSITTKTTSTLAALNASSQLLSTQGIMTIICYRGHDGGLSESNAVMQWLATQTHLTHHIIDSNKATTTTPFLLVIKHLEDTT